MYALVDKRSPEQNVKGAILENSKPGPYVSAANANEKWLVAFYVYGLAARRSQLQLFVLLHELFPGLLQKVLVDYVGATDSIQ